MIPIDVMIQIEIATINFVAIFAWLDESSGAALSCRRASESPLPKTIKAPYSWIRLIVFLDFIICCKEPAINADIPKTWNSIERMKNEYFIELA